MRSVARPTPVAAVARFYYQVIAALLEGGCSAIEAVHAFDMLLLFSFASVLWQLPRREVERKRLVRLALERQAAAAQGSRPGVGRAQERLVRQAADIRRHWPRARNARDWVGRSSVTSSRWTAPPEK